MDTTFFMTRFFKGFGWGNMAREELQNIEWEGTRVG